MVTPEGAGATGDTRLVARLRLAAILAMLVGAAGSVAFMFWAGRNSSSKVSLAIIAIWVVSPYAAFALATVLAKRWSARTRTMLYGVIVLLTTGALAVYAYDAMRPRRAQAAFVFVVVPPALWVLMAIAVATAAVVARNRLASTPAGTTGPM